MRETKPASFEEVISAIEEFRATVYFKLNGIIFSLKILQDDIMKQTKELKDEAEELKANTIDPDLRRI